MLVLVSVLGGGLLAGLAVPSVGLAASGLKAASAASGDLAKQLADHPQFQRSTITMADGSTLATFYDQNRVYVPLSQIATIMQNAQVAIEDHRFYQEGAVDLNGILRALVKNVIKGKNQGGSTLTQQYVKQVRVQLAMEAGDSQAVAAATENTLQRKLIEVQYALGVEKSLTKQQILERYLNISYYGDGAYGVQAAAQHYFGTDAAHLTLAQAALLAGIVQDPVNDNPATHPSVALDRRGVVLDAMVEWGYVTAAQASAAKAEPFNPSKVAKMPNGCASSRYPFVCDYIVRTLTSNSMSTLGDTSAARLASLKRGGLTIKTQIDPKVQDIAQRALNAKIDPRDPVVATVVQISPKTGELVSMVQSRPKMGTNVAAGETYYNFAVGTSMGGTNGYQGGSTFKTFTLTAALASGWKPTQTLTVPYSLDLNGMGFTSCSGPFTFTGNHTVVNDTPSEQGTMTLADATTNSINTFFTELESQVGLCKAVQVAQSVGVQRGDGKALTDAPYFDRLPSFTLGTVEATPLSMTNAYATYANRGVRCDPLVLSSVARSDGSGVAVPSANCTAVMDPKLADGVSSVLANVMTSGTGTAAFVPGYAQAGKTGTVTGATAVWFDGYTPDLAGTVMIAVDTSNSWWKQHGVAPSLANLTLPYSGTPIDGFGGKDAAPIWHTVMAAELPSLPNTQFTPYVP